MGTLWGRPPRFPFGSFDATLGYSSSQEEPGFSDHSPWKEAVHVHFGSHSALIENPKKIIEKRLGSTLKIVRFREPSVRILNSVVTGDFEEYFSYL